MKGNQVQPVLLISRAAAAGARPRRASNRLFWPYARE